MSFLFGGKKPVVQPTARMPDAQSPAVLEAARRQRLEVAARGGRSSTILSGGAPGGTAPVYSNATLGGGS